MRTIHTFNGDYDIDEINENMYSVQLFHDEVIYHTEKEAYMAIHKYVLEVLWESVPYKNAESLTIDNLKKVVQYIRENERTKQLFYYVVKRYAKTEGSIIIEAVDNNDPIKITDTTIFMYIFTFFEDLYMIEVEKEWDG